ncbi:MAG: hypothetical protein Q8904_09790 [Bacteroidota bacterium]|nr:hypothetical protein [Bacteroidota bacterium]
MKSNISPQEYSKIIESIELNDIVLIESALKVADLESSGGTISLNLSDKYIFKENDNKVSFYATFKLLGKKDNSDSKDSIFTITAKYKISYFKPNELVITNDFFDVFKELSLSMLIWPYMREFIQNNLNRAGLPPLTLPLKKIC